MKNLDTLIPEYVESKKQLDDVKAHVEECNRDIKEMMEELGQDEYCVGDIKAKVCVSTKVTMNEEKLLRLLKTELANSDLDVSNLFITKEYVNMDELENMLYNKLIPENVVKAIAGCKDEKEVKSLRIGKAKAQV